MWIKTKDQVPEETTLAWFYIPGQGCYLGFYSSGNWEAIIDSTPAEYAGHIHNPSVTHWKAVELPEPPIEDER